MEKVILIVTPITKGLSVLEGEFNLTSHLPVQISPSQDLDVAALDQGHRTLGLKNNGKFVHHFAICS